MAHEEIYRLTNSFYKLSQVMDPGTSWKPNEIIDMPIAMGLAAEWADLIKSSGRPRRAGWKRKVAEIVFDEISNAQPDPLNHAAAKMDLKPNPREIIQWVIMDIEGHYSDLIPVQKAKQVLEQFL